jgi:hypothetical protein
VTHEVITGLEQLGELDRLVVEIDAFERWVGRIPAPRGHDQREPIGQRTLRPLGLEACADTPVDKDQTGPGAEHVDVHHDKLQASALFAKPCGFWLLQALVCSPRMEPSPRQTLDPAGAGAVLVGTTVSGVGLGALIGWAVGSWPVGALVGAVVGIPASIFVVYRRYRGVFT